MVTSLSMEILEHFRSQPGSTCLKCLLEPKFIYNIGISSIAVIIDLAHFIKQLMSAVHIKEENG